MKKYIFLLGGAIMICITIFWISHMKISVKADDLKSENGYILVKTQMSTVSEWLAIADNNGEYDIPRDVRIAGNMPGGYNYAIETGDNIFVCYGKYISFNHKDEAGTYDIFHSNSWDIIFPIQRNSIFNKILPKTYLCFFDK